MTGPRLRRELRFAETASVSIGVMAPTLAMSVTGVAAAASLGRAAPLAFVVASLGVGLVAFGFVRLTGRFAHAGSVYALVGRTLHPRAGFVAGWALLGTYLVFPPVSIMGVAVFGRALLRVTGAGADVDWYPLALAGWAVIGYLALRGIRPTTRWMLAFEIGSVLLILVLVVTVYARLVTGTAPRGLRPSADVVHLPAGVGVGALALAATAGFLAFAGFESAGSLGEESLRPLRSIPRALALAVGFGAVFYVLCMVAQSWGFGTDDTGVAAFRASQAPLADLAERYVGSPLAAALDVGAVLSALGAGLGGVTVGARMLFVLGRDGIAPGPLGAVRERDGVPVRALAVELGVALVLLTGFRLVGTAPLDVFFYLATMGVLSLLVMYTLTNVAAARHLYRESRLEVLLPAAGIAVSGYVLYGNVWPFPSGAARVPPVAVVAWLVLGVVLAIRVGDRALRPEPAGAAVG